jgi:hypothetical protein
MIEPGRHAPDFALTDQDGREVKLSDFRDWPVGVYLYPKADTPGSIRRSDSAWQRLQVGSFNGDRTTQDMLAFREGERAGAVLPSRSSRTRRCSSCKRAMRLLPSRRLLRPNPRVGRGGLRLALAPCHRIRGSRDRVIVRRSRIGA